MLRTKDSRQARALLVIVTVVMALVMGALGQTAAATEPDPGPDPGTTSGAPTEDGDSADPLDDSLAEESPTDGPTPLLREDTAAELVGDPLQTPTPETRVVPRGRATTFNVSDNFQCPTEGGCTFSRGSYVPSGWGYSLGGTSGLLTVKVPATNGGGRFNVYYKVTHTESGQSVQGWVTILVTLDGYNPGTGMTFTHPYRKAYRNKIRTILLRTINSVPPGERIRIASWSFSSRAYLRALANAKRRGVSVQIVLAMRNKAKNSDYRLLARTFGTRTTSTGSFVRKCAYSCRGRGGTMHSKIFMFSRVYNTPHVLMSGSANFTDFAVTNQWNQMHVQTRYRPAYDDAVRIFTQMIYDRPAYPQYVEKHYPNMWMYYYPRGRASVANDFAMKALAPVRCTGAVNAGRNGRTVIRIAMYAWYQQRGKWLAKRVRQLWNAGCDVRIVFGISSDPVKKLLYSPAGRGRIPMRQILLTNRKFQPIYYIHDKWMTISGHYGSNRSANLSWQGSFNFSDVGFISDENFQMLAGRGYFNAFNRDFTLLWKDRQARAPSPISKIPTIEGRWSRDDLRLGTGRYRYMEAG